MNWWRKCVISTGGATSTARSALIPSESASAVAVAPSECAKTPWSGPKRRPTSAIACARSSTVTSVPLDWPWPGRSTATTWKPLCTRGRTSAWSWAASPFHPWTRSTVGPSPHSQAARVQASSSSVNACPGTPSAVGALAGDGRSGVEKRLSAQRSIADGATRPTPEATAEMTRTVVLLWGKDEGFGGMGRFLPWGISEVCGRSRAAARSSRGPSVPPSNRGAAGT